MVVRSCDGVGGVDGPLLAATRTCLCAPTGTSKNHWLTLFTHRFAAGPSIAIVTQVKSGTTRHIGPRRSFLHTNRIFLPRRVAFLHSPLASHASNLSGPSITGNLLTVSPNALIPSSRGAERTAMTRQLARVDGVFVPSQPAADKFFFFNVLQNQELANMQFWIVIVAMLHARFTLAGIVR